MYGNATLPDTEFVEQSAPDLIPGTHPVKHKAANAWRLHDMLGNVFEWCEDPMLGEYSGAPTDGSAWLKEGATDRVTRGGAWNHPARFIRAACRAAYPRDSSLDYLGFRCAVTAD